jgi:hypothetical protein
MTDYDEILTTDGGTNDYVLYDYQDPDVFAKISKTSYDFTAQSPIKGYLFKVKNDDTPLVMKGTINNDAIYTKTLQSDWQVIANPYPSHYQFPIESGAGSDLENTTGDVYVTVSTSNADKVFHTYNTLLGIGSPAEFDGVIAPGQGFYIQTYTPGEITMRASNRMHSTVTQLKSANKKKEADVLRLKLKNENGAKDEAVIVINENEQDGFTKLDSEQRFKNNGVSYIYSVVEDKKAVINAVPGFNGDFSQTLGIQTKEGTHFMYIEGIEELSTDYEIVLEDKETGEFTTMLTGVSYEFTSAEGSFDERFVLHMSKIQVATSLDEHEMEEESSEEQEVKVYIQNGNQLEITCDWNADNKQVSVFSVNGEEVFKDRFAGRSYNSTLSVTTRVYIIQVIGEQSHFQQKVLIK